MGTTTNKLLFDTIIKYAKAGRSTDYVCGSSFHSTEEVIKERKVFDEFINNIEGTNDFPYNRFYGNAYIKNKTMDKNTEINTQFIFPDPTTEIKIEAARNAFFTKKENTDKKCCGGIDKQRKYLPQIGELLDRCSILQLKELLLKEHRAEFAKEIQDILHDINLILKENNINITAETLRAIIVLAQANLHIWHAESKARATGTTDGSNLIFTHTENGVRTRARDRIQSAFGGRTDPKTDCLAAEYNHMEPSWDGK